jgi:hypothetical protein
VLELGQEIVRQLNPNNDNDLLSAWIAQDLAEKLRKHAQASGSERTHLGADIFELILKVWQHRASLPSVHRPFERYESIFRALESLDPEKQQFRYFADDFARARKEKGEVEQWLDTAKAIDRLARSLIAFCLGSASAAAGQPNEAWLKAAKTLKTDEELEIKIVFLTSEMARTNQDAAALKRAELARMRERVEALAAVSSDILKEIERRTEEIAT